MNKIMITSILCMCMIIACNEVNAKTADDILSEQGTLDLKLLILIDNTTELTATLYNNSSAKALVSLLRDEPLTLEMHDYGGFEKVGSLPQSLPRNDTRITTHPGDIILYQGSEITFYYAENTWNFTLLGRIDGKTQSELRAIFGSGSITVTLSLAQ